MNIPILRPRWEFPGFSLQTTQGAFVALPTIAPCRAVVDIQGSNPMLSATATVAGVPAPVIVVSNTAYVSVQTTLAQEGQIVLVKWLFVFAQAPTLVSIEHRLLVKPAQNNNALVPSNPCDTPCGPLPIPLLLPDVVIARAAFATSGNVLGLDINLPMFNSMTGLLSSEFGYTMIDWCNVDKVGVIDFAEYTPNISGPPDWREVQRYCLSGPPRTNSLAIVIEQDFSPNSPTFSGLRTTTASDPLFCPLGLVAPDWQNDGQPECQPEPRTSCAKRQLQVDRNPISPSFDGTRYIILPFLVGDCDDCPATSTLPDWQDTFWQCAQLPLGRTSSAAEMQQVDRNPFSPSFNQPRIRPLGDRPDLCPIDPNSCNVQQWIDAQDVDCNPIIRCKQDAPRSTTTRQKQQVQINPVHALPPSPLAIRWADMAPTLQDAISCPLQICQVFVPVCPVQTRCKFPEPRTNSTVERLEYEVIPDGIGGFTLGPPVWRDFGVDATLCPLVVPPATQFSLSFTIPLIYNSPSDIAVAGRGILGCNSNFLSASPNNASGNNFGRFNIVQGNVSVQRTGPSGSPVASAFDVVSVPPTAPPFYVRYLITTNSVVLDCRVLHDSDSTWAKAYHRTPVLLQDTPLSGTGSLRFAFAISTSVGNNYTTDVVCTDFVTNAVVPLSPLADQIIFTAPYNLRYRQNACGANPANQQHQDYYGANYPILQPPVSLPQVDVVDTVINDVRFMAVGDYMIVHRVRIGEAIYAEQTIYVKNI